MFEITDNERKFDSISILPLSGIMCIISQQSEIASSYFNSKFIFVFKRKIIVIMVNVLPFCYGATILAHLLFFLFYLFES